MYSGKTWTGSACVNLKKECLQGNYYIPPPPLSLPLPLPSLLPPLPSPTGRASCPIGGGPSPGTARWQEHSRSTAPASSSPVGGGGWVVVGGGWWWVWREGAVESALLLYYIPPSSLPPLPPSSPSLPPLPPSLPPPLSLRCQAAGGEWLVVAGLTCAP